jgi:hypothetical protein
VLVVAPREGRGSRRASGALHLRREDRSLGRHRSTRFRPPRPRARVTAGGRAGRACPPLGSVGAALAGLERDVLGHWTAARRRALPRGERAQELLLRSGRETLGPTIDAESIEAWSILRGFRPRRDGRRAESLRRGSGTRSRSPRVLRRSGGGAPPAHLRQGRAQPVTVFSPRVRPVPPRGGRTPPGERALGTITSAVRPAGNRGTGGHGVPPREAAHAGTHLEVVWEGGSADGSSPRSRRRGPPDGRAAAPGRLPRRGADALPARPAPQPGAGFEVHRTAGLVAERLRGLGAEVRTGVGRTGS